MKTIPQRSVIRACLRHVWVRGLEQRRAELLAIDLYPAVVTLAPGLQAGELARRVADAASAACAPAPCAKRQWTLPELADPARLAEWLAHDGEVPTVEVETAESRFRWSGYGARKTESRPVVDAETAALWYKALRDDLWTEWCKSPLNKRYTDKQFMRDCCKELGLKGSIAECKAKAKELRPDLYGDEDPALRDA